jgi:hypothetical protein
MSYVPNNLNVYCQALAGAVDGLLARSVPLKSTPGYYAASVLIAGAFAQAFDTAWNSHSDPDTFEYSSIYGLSDDYFTIEYVPIGNPEDSAPSTYAETAANLLAIIGDAEAFLAGQGITPPPLGAGVQSVAGSPPITSTGGQHPVIGITPATEIAAGSMSAADKTKLDGLTGGSNIFGAFATRPATAPVGSQFVTSDGPVDFVWNGTVWMPLISGNVLPPPPAAAGWTVDSIGTGGAAPGSIADAQGTILITPGTRDTLYLPPQSGAKSQIVAAFDQTVNPNWHNFQGGGNPGFGVAIFQPAVTGGNRAYWRFSNYYDNSGVQHAQLQSFTGTAFPFGAGSVPFDLTGTPPLGGKYQYFKITFNDPTPGDATFWISANGEDWVPAQVESPAFQDAGQPVFGAVSFGQNATAALSRLYSAAVT